MSDSTPVPKVYAAMSAVQGILAQHGIGKGRKNEQQGYAFRGIDDIYNFIANSLAAEKLLIIPRTLTREVKERETKAGGALFYVVVEMEFDFVCALDGSKHTARMVGEAMDSGDKATNKAQSAAFKYVCLQTFCIPTEGMPENDADFTTQPSIKPANGKAETAPDKPAASTPAPKPAPTPAPAKQPAKNTVSAAPRPTESFGTEKPLSTAASELLQPAKAAKTTVVEKIPSAAKQAANAPKVNDWREVVIHFGKRKGVSLGELQEDSLVWFITKWDPKALAEKSGYPMSEQDVIMRKACDIAGASMALPGFGEPPQQDAPDEIPGL